MAYLTDADKKILKQHNLDTEKGWIDFLCTYENLMRGSMHTGLSMDKMDLAFREMNFKITLKDFIYKHGIKDKKNITGLRIDLDLAREMYSKAATDDEVAAGIGIPISTFKEFLRDRLGISLANFRKESKAQGINALKNRMFDLANMDNEKMILYLAKFFAKMEKEEMEHEKYINPKILINLKQNQPKTPKDDEKE